jgi:hypothetical protein
MRLIHVLLLASCGFELQLNSLRLHLLSSSPTAWSYTSLSYSLCSAIASPPPELEASHGCTVGKKRWDHEHGRERGITSPGGKKFGGGDQTYVA